MKHLLSVDQLSRESVDELLSLASAFQPIARRKMVTRVLEGAVLANLFFEASTRTRVSFGAAFCRLGGSVCDTTGFTFSSMAKGESIYDTSRVVSGYVDAMVIRHPDKGAVAKFAAATNVPVINGGDGPGEHPSQALLDLFTISSEFARLGRPLEGSHIAIMGDLKYGRTVHSLLKLLALYHKVTFSLVSPPTLSLPDELLEMARSKGHAINLHSSPEEIRIPIDVIYATRIQKERFSAEELESGHTTFQVNAELVAKLCSANTIIMHPLPRDSTFGANDLSTDLNSDTRLAIFRQTDAGIPVRMAIFAKLLGVERFVLKDIKKVKWFVPEKIGPDDAIFHTLA